MSDQVYGINVPAADTLRKYGLTFSAWLDIVDQDVVDDCEGAVWLCPVCRKTPRTGRTVVDHFHVRGWKTMSPLLRVKYVRGVVCTTCNHFILTRYGSPEKFRLAAAYLERYEKRAP